MRDLIFVFVHLITTFFKLARPGGLPSVIAESVLMHSMSDTHCILLMCGIFGERKSPHRGPRPTSVARSAAISLASTGFGTNI